MELLSIVASLVAIAQGMVALRDKFRTDPKRAQFADWLGNTARVLAEVADALARGEYPHAQCGHMQECLENSYILIKKYMTPERAEHIHNLMQESYQVERLFGELNQLSETERARNINKIREISGIIQSAAQQLALE